ncbi:MAG: hypothetical protein KKA07_13590, partial [Bacteroidetes bacterium]|nr:hypothetical protein [Bacteroidota bacterium]
MNTVTRIDGDKHEVKSDLSDHTHTSIPPVIEFVENKGQFHPNSVFKAELGGGALFIEKNCLTFSLFREADMHHSHAHHGELETWKSD